MDLLNILLVFAGTLIGSIGSSSVVLYMLKRRDKVESLAIHNNRLGEAIDLLMETQLELIDTLHENGTINGQGKILRDKIRDYQSKCMSKGFVV